MKTSVKDLSKYFTFLDQLRESGVTNMYGASPYLKKAFPATRDDANKIVIAWMRSFSHEKSASDRAQESMEALAS